VFDWCVSFHIWLGKKFGQILSKGGTLKFWFPSYPDLILLDKILHKTTGHAKKIFWTVCGGGGGGVFGLFLIQIYKKCNEGGGGGRGQKVKKIAKFTFFVNQFFK
jgi:hypothetical protein